MEATPETLIKGKNVLATDNSSTKNEEKASISSSKTIDKNVPKVMEAPVKTTAGESPSC